MELVQARRHVDQLGECLKLSGGGAASSGVGGKGQSWDGSLQGSKGANFMGEVNGILLQFEFRFRNGKCRKLALQSFRITHVINAEICAKFVRTRN